ncbi:MAG TPA: glycoside hydrolase family 3 C-terminal domain-containing protein [Bryobacteraceae bacterium]|nr:glycoside hydrolase family 3 C-terminal domain-containing protein [Bryobacteraceae bacterium]
MINRYVCLFALVCWAGVAQEPYKNPDLSPEQRAADLVSRMTLEEKVLQMQNSAPAIERLGIPQYDWWNEALHGVARAGEATVFPQAIGLAATWDTDLQRRVAEVISTEARAKYNQAQRDKNYARYFGLTFWSPNINIFRDPRWGRGQETYGEDPYLTGEMAIAFIKGMQGDDPHYFKVIATAKHYAVHSGPETSRHEFDVHPTQRDFDDTYTPQFRAAIVEGKADSVMCAYNRVNGLPACANPDLLQKKLKDEWGFKGYIVSDCGAITDIFRGHKYKANAAEASAVAVKSGTDLTCGNEYRALVDAVKQGLITEKEVNTSLERLFVARFRLGMFDPPERVPFSKIPYSEVDSEEHRKLALEAARKSIVLLKNENQILPLAASVKTIAVIGPGADDDEALLGNYNGFSVRQVSALEGVTKQFAGKSAIRFALGATYTTRTHAPIPTAALTPPEGSGHGVLAEYFDNPRFEGTAKARRVEPRPGIGDLPDQTLLSAGVPRTGFSVRWTGTLRAPVTGDYMLGVRNAGGRGALPMRVFIDDKEVVGDSATQGLARVREAQTHLEAGHAYKLRVQYGPAVAANGAEMMWIPPAEPLLAEAMDAIRNSDVAVIFAGLNANLEGEEMSVALPGFAGGDRTSLDLPDTQQKLIDAALASGKPVILVISTGSAVSVNSAAARAAGVIEMWYAGEEAGTAIAETLAGVNNPSARLPVTFYKSVNDLPPFDDYSMKNRTYRYFKSAPLYGFGYGLSYSAFQYSNLKTNRGAAGGNVTVTVKNTSGRDGDEVAQLYIAGAGGPDDAIRQLRGFQRVHLKAGEARNVTFNVPQATLPKGKSRITVGGGQPLGGVAHVTGAL